MQVPRFDSSSIKWKTVQKKPDTGNSEERKTEDPCSEKGEQHQQSCWTGRVSRFITLRIYQVEKNRDKRTEYVIRVAWEVSPHLSLSLSTRCRVIFANALSNLAASSRIGSKFRTSDRIPYHPPQFTWPRNRMKNRPLRIRGLLYSRVTIFLRPSIRGIRMYR